MKHCFAIALLLSTSAHALTLTNKDEHLQLLRERVASKIGELPIASDLELCVWLETLRSSKQLPRDISTWMAPEFPHHMMLGREMRSSGDVTYRAIALGYFLPMQDDKAHSCLILVKGTRHGDLSRIIVGDDRLLFFQMKDGEGWVETKYPLCGSLDLIYQIELDAWFSELNHPWFPY